MDPRDRADALLSRAQAREGVVTPDNMTSPMDASNTQQIPRSVVRSIDEQDPDSTTRLPHAMIEESMADGDGRPSHLTEQQPTTRLDEPGGEVEETRLDGLVPTTTTRRGQSELSRRLEGR
ncbi:hypothetical protein B0I33_112165 [Prauserella shujinwangii]|uniref:Uncharacterized protein n=1 Tax=Prauserella shujinwangii TaxID=1453103 RepID=A0A2T0LMI0_9PSEU|nr:hypothetical protein [Prauserella shujinwangii]PRX44287.1 hypothetical protein B0I33_112165 [Prauserella shujinwangii]